MLGRNSSILNEFTGIIDNKYNQLPTSLTSLVHMILNGTGLTYNADHAEISVVAKSISQLLIYNSIKRGRKEKTTETIRHNPSRQTALPLYMGLLLYNKTRKRDLVDTCHDLGLSVSYSRGIIKKTWCAGLKFFLVLFLIIHIF